MENFISELQWRPKTTASDTTDDENVHFSPHGGLGEPSELTASSYWGPIGKKKQPRVIMLMKSDLLSFAT